MWKNKQYMVAVIINQLESGGTMSSRHPNLLRNGISALVTTAAGAQGKASRTVDTHNKTQYLPMEKLHLSPFQPGLRVARPSSRTGSIPCQPAPSLFLLAGMTSFGIVAHDAPRGMALGSC